MRKLNKNILLFFLILVSGFSCSSKANEMEGVLSQLIKSQQLKIYWHIDSFPERVPLVVVLPDDFDKSNIKAEIFGQPVLFSTSHNKKDISLIVREIKKDKDKMVLKFLYPPEGIRGEASYKKSEGKWSLKDIKVYES